MLKFFTKRILTSALVVFVSTAIMYVLVDLAIDPLFDLRQSTAPNKEQQIAARIAELNLDQPVLSRYLDWLQGASTCLVPGGGCDLGENWITNQQVTSLLGGAIATTIKLITVSTILAIVLGSAVGIITALRQYSGFDYSITFISFLFFSLPVFWVAVLAKAFLAIDFNNFLADPTITPGFIVAAGALTGLVIAAAMGGSWRRRGMAFAAGFAAVAVVLVYMNLTDWLTNPSIGIVLLAISAVGWAFLVTLLSTGLGNRKALYSALTVAGIGVALYYPMLFFWAYVDESWLMVLGLGIVSVLVGAAVGFAFRGPDPSRSARTAALTAIPVSMMLFVDRVMQSWSAYTSNQAIKGRPIATFAAQTPNLEGSFWIQTIDTFTHLLLPTLTLILISFAGYTRYSRASMLEVMNQDYIRTARSKGLTERTVVMRHAFRNAMLPLASIVPVDIITLIGGAVITETVFSWFGMGRLFINSLGANQIDPVMAYLTIVAILAVVANIVADLVYAVLDPRIRVNA